MTTATYYFMNTGGVGFTPDGTIPDGGVPCTQAQYANPGQWYIDYSTAPPTIKPVAAATSLQLAQSAQIMKLANWCSNAIFVGYKSSALGSSFLYPAKTTDQMNMLSSLVSALGTVLFDTDDWTPNTDVVEGQQIWINKQLYSVTQYGRTGAQEPLWPQTAGAPIVDGSALWTLWTTPFWCADLSVTPSSWAFRNHTLRQIWQVGKDAKQSILDDMGLNQELVAQVMSAQSPQDVEAIVWP